MKFDTEIIEFDRDFPVDLKKEVLSRAFDEGESGPIAAGRDRDGDWAVFYRPSVPGGISWTRKIAWGDHR